MIFSKYIQKLYYPTYTSVQRKYDVPNKLQADSLSFATSTHDWRFTHTYIHKYQAEQEKSRTAIF